MTAYLLTSSLLLTVFYTFFMLFMRKTTFFRFNRAAVLAGTLACMLLPLFDFGLPALPRHRPDFPEDMQMTRFIQAFLLPEAAAGTDGAGGSGWRLALAAVYAAGGTAVLVATAVSLARICLALSRTRGLRQGRYIIHAVEGDFASFSFFNHIAISRRDIEEHPEILLHECVHAGRLHSLDLMLMSLVTAVHWFNPLVHLMRSELRLLHEYEADEAVLDSGIDASRYQLLLVRKAVGDRRFLIASSFDHSKLKNRITMMHKFKTTSWARLGYLACLPLMVLTLCFCTNAESSDDKRAQQTAQEVRDGTPATDSSTDPGSGTPGQDTATGEEATSSEQVYDFGAIEQKPLFNGDSANGFALWLSENLVYPQAERQAGTEGRVILAFTIGTDGRLGDIDILRSAGSKALDDAAVAAVSKSPAWTPGKVGGEPVAVRFSMPIVFQISE